MFSAGRHEGSHQVASTHEIFRVEAAVIARPQRKALVMPGRQHGVGKARVLGGFDPFVRVVAVGIKILGEFKILIRRRRKDLPPNAAKKIQAIPARRIATE